MSGLGRLGRPGKDPPSLPMPPFRLLSLIHRQADLRQEQRDGGGKMEGVPLCGDRGTDSTWDEAPRPHAPRGHCPTPSGARAAGAGQEQGDVG